MEDLKESLKQLKKHCKALKDEKIKTQDHEKHWWFSLKYVHQKHYIEQVLEIVDEVLPF